MSSTNARRFGGLILGTLALSWLAGAPARAIDLFCARCGCGDSCQKTCRLVKEEKKVQVTCWGSECEDFCVPGPSKRGCKHCETVCDENDPKGPCTHSRPFVWTEWIPADCAKVFTKTKLMKKTVTKKVPSYKWVVEDLCEKCAAETADAPTPTDAKIPPKPIVDAPSPASPKTPAPAIRAKVGD